MFGVFKFQSYEGCDLVQCPLRAAGPGALAGRSAWEIFSSVIGASALSTQIKSSKHASTATPQYTRAIAQIAAGSLLKITGAEARRKGSPRTSCQSTEPLSRL